MTSDLDLLSMTTEQEYQEVIPEETEVIIPVFKKNKKRVNSQAQTINLIKGRAVRSRLALIRKQYIDKLIADRYKLTADRIIENARNLVKRRVREEYENNLKYPQETMTEAEFNQIGLANHNFKNPTTKEVSKPILEFTYC